MSIQSVPASPPDTTTQSGAGKSGKGDGKAATGFAALLAGALSGIGLGGKAAGKGLSEAADDVLGTAADDTLQAETDTTTPMPSTDPSLLAAAVQPVVVQQAVAQSSTVTDPAQAATAVTGATAAAAATPAVATAAPAPASQTTQTTQTTQPDAEVKTSAPAAPTTGGVLAQAAETATGTTSDAGSDTAPDGGDQSGDRGSRADVALAPSLADAPVDTTPDSNPVATVTGAHRAEAGGQTASAAHVTGQVFPEVTRLATLGNGTHRVTLKLNPENLGEVRVTLTVRDGAVRVTMSGSDDATRSLLAGSADLHRLLAASGAVDTQVSVRDHHSGDLLGQSRSQDGQRQFQQSNDNDPSSHGFGEAHRDTPHNTTGREERALRTARPMDGAASTSATSTGSAQEAATGVDVTV